MNSPIIRVESISKEYAIGGRRESYGTLRDALASAFSAPGRRKHRVEGRDAKTFWALKSVSFDVPRGEVLGIIGRNGAGKSTLLKVLSRITEPTAGRVRIRGRVASLLEVGTGFHAELTGRENLFLNGAILGMGRREIERKFDEIVSFAEVERFIDTPVKRYSSGMYLRLAFAVAAHLEPEILVIDEVLAVGDAAFQDKCMGKMRQAATQGRTVLFVSHNMASIRGLCSRCIWIDQGTVRRDGDPASVVEEYLAQDAEMEGSVDLSDHPGRRPASTSRALRKLVVGAGPSGSATMPVGRPLEITIELGIPEALRCPRASLWVTSAAGDRLFTIDSSFQPNPLGAVQGQSRLRCSLSELALVPGRYTISVAFGDYARFTEWIDHASAFCVTPDDFFGVGRLPPEGYGVLFVRGNWHTEEPTHNSVDAVLS